MPQASDEERAAYRERFGDIGCEHAVAELERRGFKLYPTWDWSAPDGRGPTPEEWDWLDFLIKEWDFGGLRRT